MPRRNRPTHVDFTKSSARRYHGRFFTLAFAPTSAPAPKFGCVVSKKVAIKAHDRNVIKRRVRACIRDLKNVAISPQIFIFTAKKSAHGAVYAAIKADISQLLSSVQS